MQDDHRDARAWRVRESARSPLCEPSPQRIATSQMTAFTSALQARIGRTFADYSQLHAFSVREYRLFWKTFVEWCPGLDYAGDLRPVCVGEDIEHASFFPGLTLNYADNLLGMTIAPADAPALCACHADGHKVRMTRGELRERVARFAAVLERLGLASGDRVVAVMRNDEHAVVTALAVTALGATLSTAPPEMGAEALLDRFAPLSPRLFIAHTAARAFDTGPALAATVAQVAAALPSLEGIISLDDSPLPSTVTQPVHPYGALTENTDGKRFAWRRFAFNHPLFIMFSSGTTGRPKCIVHGAGGTLIEHLKEHRLHTDLRAGDRLYFHTSCAWMMWNWQLSALASGVEIVVYDGPLSAVDTLWRLVADEQVNVFGISPAYLKMCEEARLEPGWQFDLRALRAMLSTGAVLYDAQHHWVRDHVGALPLQSISGGTDIIGCFVLGNPNLPVHAGEAQCKSLGLDVQAWAHGAPTHGIGQLVCANPFPSRPLGFFGDAQGARFHAAYFDANPGVWTHGDLIEFSPQGSARLHGRSDGVLNVRGINVGPTEIYRVLSDIPGIRDAMVVDRRPSPMGTGEPGFAAYERGEAGEQHRGFVLLLVLHKGAALTGALHARIRRDLARRASPAHVPDLIMAIDALPVTHSGKLSDAAARNAVNGLPLDNVHALRNPGSLEAIRCHPALALARRPLPPAVPGKAELETYLQALWEKLFGFSPIGRDDNFFDLGGDSMMAAELASHVHDATGYSISLATLLIAPSIARLAQVVRGGSSIASSATLVPLRAGSGTPVFLVHSVTGSVVECRSLIAALRTPRPIYGLNARGLDGEAAPQRHVVEMAATYVKAMRRVQAHGPYALLGYSFGGLIALEIAQQLHRAGERVDTLCLLDTYVHERCLPWRDWLRYQAGYVERQWQSVRALSASQRVRYLRGKAVAAADRIRMRFGYTAHRAAADAVGLPPVLLRMREAMRTAMTTYRPKACRAGPIVFVRASVAQPGRADPLPLWRRVARAGLHVAEVDGGHSDLILDPTVHAVARVIDAALCGDLPWRASSTPLRHASVPELQSASFSSRAEPAGRLVNLGKPDR